MTMNNAEAVELILSHMDSRKEAPSREKVQEIYVLKGGDCDTKEVRTQIEAAVVVQGVTRHSGFSTFYLEPASFTQDGTTVNYYVISKKLLDPRTSLTFQGRGGIVKVDGAEETERLKGKTPVYQKPA